MKNEEILLENIKDVKKMLWEDRKFLIGMMMKIDRIVDFVSDVTTMEEAIFDNNIEVDEEQILKSIMNSLKDDIDNKKEEFIKYHKMINSDQVGES